MSAESSDRLVKINDVIANERQYQDAKWGTVEDHPHSVLEWIIIMKHEIQEAEDAWFKEGEAAAMVEITQAVAVGHAAMEQHGPEEGHR